MTGVAPAGLFAGPRRCGIVLISKEMAAPEGAAIKGAAPWEPLFDISG
jgi:hypothetical protein